jgi:hypothetical protein
MTIPEGCEVPEEYAFPTRSVAAKGWLFKQTKLVRSKGTTTPYNDKSGGSNQ